MPRDGSPAAVPAGPDRHEGGRAGIEETRRLARRLLADYDARTPGRLFRQGLELTIPEAYEVQAEVARLREQRGERVIGYKVGCTSRPIREQLGVTEPIFGRLFDTECFRSGARLSHARYAHLAVEGELAVRLSRDLAAASPLSDEVCLAAIGSVFPVIELHHYVRHGARSAGPALVASNGMHAGFVHAEAEARRPGLPDVAARLSIRIDEAVVDAAAEEPGATPGPVESLRWLAGRLAGSGLRLSGGQVILTGSPMRLFPVAPGRRVAVEAGPLGRSVAEIDP